MAFTWDTDLRQYRYGSNRLVPESRVESWVDDLALVLALFWAERYRSYLAREITFEQFFTATQGEIYSLHQAMTAVAFGGVKQAVDYDYNRMEQIAQEQLQFFYMFAVQIYNEQQSEAQVYARFAAYALAAFATYQTARVFREQDAKMLLYRRVLDPKAENCEDCIEYALRRWRVIGTLPRIGQSQCRSRCRCRWEFSSNLALLGQ